MPGSLRRMNGKVFTHFTFTDGGVAGRRTQIGRHTGAIEGARAYYDRLAGYGEPSGGVTPKVWLEDAQGRPVPYPPRAQARKAG